MKNELIKAASLVIPNPQMLVNVVSRRVRQLAQGHRPLIVALPGMPLADVALTEIAEKKLGYESTLGLGKGNEAAVVKVVPFPDGNPPKKKAA
ncbi:MAG: DNA-directed RNA polymerase subunit omega [Chthoniobacterales bacterium]